MFLYLWGVWGYKGNGGQKRLDSCVDLLFFEKVVRCVG